MATLLQEEELGQRGAVRAMRYELTEADASLGAGVYTFDFPELPIGTLLLHHQCNVQEVADSGTSDSLELGDGTDPNAYGTANDQQAASNAPFAAGADPFPRQLVVATSLRLTLTTVGIAPTQGKTHVTIVYVAVNP